MNATINDSGLVDGSTNSYRVVAKIASGAPSAGVSMNFTGNVTVRST